MPSDKILSKKQQIVAELTERLKKSSAGVLIDYKGINVEQDTALRVNFRNSNVKYDVIKNTLLRFAVKEAGLDELDNVLEGTTSLATSEDDAIAPSKIFIEFLKKNKDLKLAVKAGFVEGKIINAKEIEALASIPPKEILISQVLGALNSPIYGLATVLNANIRGLAIALNAIAEKKQA